MKLIHCSDLHLDSPMEANLSPEKAKIRNTELCQSFARMVSFAQTQGVLLILIAGDLFDSQRISSTTADFVLSTISGAPDIDFLYLRGNHDESERAFSGKALPENLKRFSEDWTYYTYDFLTIAGAELTDDNCESIYDSLILDEQNTNIVMLHGQDTTRPGPDCVCIPLLRDRGIDYLALGHLHSYREEPLDNQGRYCYCGCLEGRGFDECGDKGFVFLDAQPHSIRSLFVPFAQRTLYDVSVDITGLTEVPQILAAMNEASVELPSKSLVKFTLKGGFTSETHKDLGFLQQMLGQRFFHVKIKDESKFTIDKLSYEHDVSLKGEFIRMVMGSGCTNEEKNAIICAGLEALRGEDISI